MTIKDKKQKESSDLYLSLKKRRATIISATGSGKSRILLLILDKIAKDYEKIYIFVNANRLRDVTWKAEFEKWERQDLLEKTEIVNYQSAYKWTKAINDLSNCFLVYDEIDFALTPEYGKIFYTYNGIDSIGLTGYCTESKIDELNQLLPIIVNYTFDEAVADGVINDVKYILVKFDLDKDPNAIEVKYKDKVTKQEKIFRQSENSAYDYADETFRIALGKYERAQSDVVLGKLSEKELKALEFKKNMAANNRAKLLYNGIASAKMAMRLQEALLAKDTNNKVMVFSKYTAQCDKINTYTYHSNNPDDVNETNFNKFNAGEIKALGCCSKVNRGDNIVELNHSILESFDSSDTVVTQRVGRNARLQVHKTAYFYILVPYFMRKNKKTKMYTQVPTQALTWATNMLIGQDINKIKVWDYRSIKSNL